MQRPRLRRLRQRLSYANVIATVALFFALTGGAMAAGKYITATDPITSGDLAGSTYGSPFIASGQVSSAKIADGAITSSKFNAAALAPNADRLDGLDSSQFVRGKLDYADVSKDGTVWASRGTSTTNAVVGAGTYELTFEQDVTSCAWIVSRTQSQHTGDADPNVQLTAEALGNFFPDVPNVVRIEARSVTGGLTLQAFSLIVVC
jgi:hypothetical protein